MITVAMNRSTSESQKTNRLRKRWVHPAACAGAGEIYAVFFIVVSSLSQRLLIEDRAIADPKLGSSHEHNRHKQDHGDGRAIAQFQVLERRLVNGHDHGATGIAWTTL